MQGRRIRRGLVALAAAMAAVATILAGGAAGYADEPPPGVAPQIIGGHEARGNTDWVVSLQYDAPAHDRYDWPVCVANLAVARDAVIGNAHCADDPPAQVQAQARAGDRKAVDAFARRWMLDAKSLAIPVADRQYKVRIGSKDWASGGIVVPVVRIELHEDWNWGQNPDRPQADLLVAQLEHTVDFQQIQIAATPGKPGDRVSMFGNGIDHPNSVGDGTTAPLPHRLQQLDTTVISPARCAVAGIGGKEICTANPGGVAGPCNGDSGGSTVRVTDQGVPELVSTVSRGGEGACGTTPAVGTSIPDYRAWIYQKIRAFPINPVPPTSPGRGDPVPVTQPGERP